MTERRRFGAKDLGLVITIITLCTLVFTFIRHPISWDKAVLDVVDHEKRIVLLEKNFAVAESQRQDILDTLKRIERKMDRR
jgi:hypothetical protein